MGTTPWRRYRWLAWLAAALLAAWAAVPPAGGGPARAPAADPPAAARHGTPPRAAARAVAAGCRDGPCPLDRARVQRGAAMAPGPAVGEDTRGDPAAPAPDRPRGPRPGGRAPRAREPGLHVVIRKGSNRLFLFRGTQLLAQFPVGTGRTPDLTPEGRFPVVVKSVFPAWRRPDGTIVPGGTPENPLGARWIGLGVVPGDGGLQYGIHGTNDPASVGRHVSAGCIRMRNEDVIWLYERVPLGTPVYIEP